MNDMSYNFEPMDNTIKLDRHNVKTIDVSKRKFDVDQLYRNK